MSVYRIFTILTAVAGLVFVNACEEETGVAERNQEKRYFDLYMAASYPDAEPESNGLYFIENKEGDGTMPDSDDWLMLNYVGYTIPDEYVVDTYLENVARDHGLYRAGAWYHGPIKLQNGSRTEGLTQGLMKMREGGEATICFKSDLGYGAAGGNPMESVGAYKSMKYEIELIKVIKDIEKYERDQLAAYVDTIPGVDTIHDPVTESVMYYLVEEHKDSTNIDNDSVVAVAYKGYLLDGTVFDESEDDDPFIFTVGDFEGAIAGWSFGLRRFKEGEKGRIFIPSQLAYGERGRILQGTNMYGMLPYEPLIFDIEVVDVSNTLSSDPGPDPDDPDD